MIYRVRVSLIPLDGDKARSIHRIEWQLPAGDLLLVASVRDQAKEVARATTRVKVYHVGP